MTNKDKFLRDGVSVEEFSQKLWNYIKNREKNEPTLLINDFLNMKVPPTLTEDERVILRNMLPEKTKEVSEFKIKRNKDSDLWLFTKGTLTNVTYQGNEVKGETNTPIIFYNHLFQFIKERRRIRDS